ncbi:MAG: peptidylprolyl isomerase [Planctomycetaceae bacterium]|jgi:parvulin-like peptidyl-prolyl isomerase
MFLQIGRILSVLCCSTAAVTIAQETPSKLNAAHILIQHADSERGSAEITRTKAEALKRATEVAALAQAKDADFAALAKEYSDGPSAADGGNLGNFKPSQMVKSFSAAAIKLQIGHVSEPVESQFGYHVILRKPLIEDLSAAHILIQYAGSTRAKASVTRSKEEALTLAQEITKQARAEGADFAALAVEHSDGPSGPRGGDLGVFAPGQMIKPFSEATSGLRIGTISDPVESQFGYHVILRKALPRMISARHILVQYQGASRADESITRSKEEARVRLEECITKLHAGETFEDLASAYSDGPSGTKGGDLGEFAEGVMHPAFDETAFALKKDEVSGAVETDFGFHVIYRYK